jgi:mannitol/fructose-specific phosphotransferase system IIA component (Ntr-type)
MLLSDYLTEERVTILKARTKFEVIDEMIDTMMNGLEDVTRNDLAEAVYEREGLMSTGIGLGIAIPHVRLAGLRDAAVAVGISRGGIDDYESIDGAPVHIVVLIIAPQGRHDLYIRLLAKIVGLLKDPEHNRAIVGAADTSAIYSTLTGGDEE